MNIITAEATVGEIVRANPACSRVFENLGIDYCCGGKKPLAEACRAKGLDPATVVAMLSALEHGQGAPETNPNALTLARLCDHIQEAHHDYLRKELPRLDFMTRKVLAVHGEHEPRLAALRNVFQSFNANMTAHTDEEEQFVFPAIRGLEAGATERSGNPSVLPGVLAKLEQEHDGAGAALEQFRSLTDDYTPPQWACNTFRTLYATLAALEKDMHQHVYKENSVLFPKALALAGGQ